MATWRLFASGPRAVLAVVAGLFVFTIVGAPPARRAIGVSVLMLVSMLPFVTWWLERQLSNRLAFMALVPQPVQPKWLVLAPMCALAVVTAAMTPMMGPAPVVATLAVLGSAWWMVGSVRWLHGVGRWALVVWPAVLLAPASAYAAYRAAGWGAAAAFAMAMGVGALLLQPRAYVGRPLPRPGETDEEANTAPSRPLLRPIVLASAGSASPLVSGARFFVVASGTSRTFLVLLFALLAIMGVLCSAPRNVLQPSLLVLLFYSGRLFGGAYTGETREFLAAKPITGRARFIGSLALPLLVVLIWPATAACLINRHLVDHGGALGWLLGHASPREDEIRFLREILGATFLPEKWPVGGLPVDLWQRLRPLLVLDRVRTTLLVLTLVFGVAPLAGRARDKRPPVLNILLMVVVIGAAIRLDGVATQLPIPPLWLSALSAAIAIADFARRARRARYGQVDGRLM